MPESLLPGMPAPDFLLKDSGTGNPTYLRDLQGSPVVLIFFDGDWDPSRSEHLARYNDVLRDLAPPNSSALASLRSLNLLQVAVGGAWGDGSDSDSAVVPLLLDREPDGEVAKRYGVPGKHAVFVIGEDGLIRQRFVAAKGLYPQPEAIRDALIVTRPVKRRDFLATTLAAAFLLALQPLTPQESRAEAVSQNKKALVGGTVNVSLKVNGETHRLNLDPRVTLLDALREYIGLTGSKKGCDHGQCGACTVHIDGRATNSCLTLAVMHQNKPITTIEGLAKGDKLHPVQAAFIEHDGFQCGYCTPGQIMSAVAILNEGHAKSSDEIREWMSGNLCRCGAYPNIVAAVEEVRLARAAQNESEGKGSRNASV